MNGFKIMGMADEGKCDHCGANCPKRRVAVMPVDADGAHGDVEFWGVVCASKVRGDRGTATDAKYLSQFARAVDEFRAAINAGGGEVAIRRASRWGFPYNVNTRRGVLEIWSGRGIGEPDAVLPLEAVTAA